MWLCVLVYAMAHIKLSSQKRPTCLLLSMTMLWCLNTALAAQDFSELLKTIEIFYYSPYVCERQQSKPSRFIVVLHCLRCYIFFYSTRLSHLSYARRIFSWPFECARVRPLRVPSALASFCLCRSAAPFIFLSLPATHHFSQQPL